MAKQIAGLKVLFGSQYTSWAWKEEQLSYTTPVYISEKIAELTTRFYIGSKKGISVWDMFAGLGVDAVCLAKINDNNKIYATEIDVDIYNLLIKNRESFQVQDRIEVFNSDNVLLLNALHDKVDVLYFDPPWGSSFDGSTKIFDFSNVKLSNGIYVIDFLRMLYNRVTKNIVIKSPLKCNTFEQLDFLHISRIIVFRKHRLKFLFITPPPV